MKNSPGDFENYDNKPDNLRNLNIVAEGLIHDFGNLLATISGLSQISMLKSNSVEVKENLATITRAAFECKLTLEKMNGYFKGNYDYSKNCFYIDNIIMQALDVVRHKIKTMRIMENIDINVHLCLHKDMEIICNDYEIKRVMLNLFLNAIDAMSDKGGSLSIRAYMIDEYPIVEVCDTGIGMDEYTKDNIFKPYFTTKKSKGTGLGLSITKEILEKHNAILNVDSIHSKGTKFTIIFPACEDIAIDENMVNMYNNI